MNYTKYKANEAFIKSLQDRYKKLLGTSDVSYEAFVKNSIINMTEAIKKMGCLS